MSKLKVLRLFHFTRNGVSDVDDPSFSQIAAAIQSLNGVDLDTLSVTLSNGDSMDVGGGKDGKFKCHAKINANFYDLINARVERDSLNLVLIMMNQEGNLFPKCCLVPCDMVMVAVKTFCSSGRLDPMLTWDNTLAYEPL